MSLKIIGMGKGIPRKRVTNDELTGFLDTSDEWIVTRTGIAGRYVCTDESLTDLSAAAALQAVRQSSLEIRDIDLVICSTIGGDYQTPSLACCVSERLGAGCPAFDINAACTGFIYALEIASGFLSRGAYKNILIVCAEMMSTKMDWRDRNTCVLFGDGAAACVVTRGSALRCIHVSSHADAAPLNLRYGTGNSPFVVPRRDCGTLHMMGRDIFKYAVYAIESEAERATETLGISPGQIDWFVLHQANKRIIDCARTKLKQPAEKFPMNIDRYGNLSSASIPLLLSEMLEDGRIQTGDTLFMAAFGAGLTAGSCVMVWEGTT